MFKETHLFKLVFGNIVLLRLIYKHVRLYRDNENVKFESLQSLREYPFREYIQSLEFNSIEELENDDIPNNGILKEVYFANYILIKCGSVIPYGVEIVRFNGSSNNKTPLLSTLPLTVNRVDNVFIPDNLGDGDNMGVVIPPNITSMVVSQLPNISGNNDNGNCFIVLPNTIKQLIFHCSWKNGSVQLRPGDLPIGLESLTLSIQSNFGVGILPSSLTELSITIDKHILMDALNKLVLPNSIKKLDITSTKGYHTSNNYIKEGFFDFLPLNIESFSFGSVIPIKRNSNLYKFNSLNVLTIRFFHSDYNYYQTIELNSLPESITDLNLSLNQGIGVDIIPNGVKTLSILSTNGTSIFKNAIPNSVTSLTLIHKVEMVDTLPMEESLTHLDLGYLDYDSIQSNLKKLIPLLPKSNITSIKLPYYCKECSYLSDIPSTINLTYTIKQNRR